MFKNQTRGYIHAHIGLNKPIKPKERQKERTFGPTIVERTLIPIKTHRTMKRFAYICERIHLLGVLRDY